ncbi:divergent polysaccharide deacetylase family protein [Malaciobacter sp. WC5094]|uniref:divergent polysaccharide deacetylase family protein n=1 Tax=Arcobacter sp. YIC-80 TaxID=3376683 RepID=UPI0038513661
MTKKTRKKSSKKTKKNSSISKVKLINIFLLVFLFAFIASALSYFIMKNEKENTNKTIIEKKEVKKFQEKKLDEFFKLEEDPKDAFEEYTQEFNKDHIDKPFEEIKQEIQKKKEELEKKKIEKTPLEKKEAPSKTTNDISLFLKKSLYKYDGKSKPKIVIMIDDVSSSRQKKAILDIGYKVNMAFLPPTKGHPNSAKIAQDLPFHMIHFPMQASSKFKGPEKNTLKITHTYEQIEQRVKDLRKWYPNAVFTNNHTGSVFTQNEEAMDKLFRALKKYNFIFVDSRTTAKSVAKKMAEKYNMPYIVRNTFMDNKKEYAYIQNQLKKAIKIAKKRGYAIAIGHPHSMTIKVLKESKHLLKGIEPIFVNELPYL